MNQSTLATDVREVAWKRDAVRLAERLARFPREQLLTAVTTLQPMRRLSGCLGGPEIWVKRDDLTGLTFGETKSDRWSFS